MKKIIAYLLILILIISCKSNIKDIKLTPIENDKKFDFYYIYTKHQADYKKPIDTIFVCKPITFRIENKTNRDLKINSAIENFLSYSNAKLVVNNKLYQSDSYKINLKERPNIRVFIHLPIPISVIDKEYLDKLYTTGNKIKNDSIVLGKISQRMQVAIDSSFKKKFIIINLLNRNNKNTEISAYYCVYKQKTFVFDSDSLSKANPRYRPDCN